MILFSEKQKFRQWWVWLMLLAVFGITVYGFYQPFNDKPSSDTGLVIFLAIPLSIIILFLVIGLETEISESGVSYRFFPFHLRKTTVPWGDIEKAFVRKYNPITEYGGWGFRLGIFGSGGALNISGNMGLQLVLKNGKRLLLGTKKPEEIEKAMQGIIEKKIFDVRIS